VKHEDAEGEYYIAEKVVFVRLLNGDVYLAEDVIRGCIAEWASELQALGVVPDYPFAIVRRWRAERADFPQGPSMKVLMDSGMPVRFRHALRIYDSLAQKVRRREVHEDFITNLAVSWEVSVPRFAAPARAQEGQYTLSVNFPAGIPEPPDAA
jgi:hypothetical protein